MRRTLGGITVALLIAALPVGLLAAPAAAQPYPPNESCSIGLSVSAVAVGGEVTLTGTGFPTGPVSIFLDDTQVATGNAASDFTVTFAIPANTAPGQHTIRAIPANGTCEATAILTVTGQGVARAGRGAGGDKLAFTGGWVLVAVALALVSLTVGTVLVVGSRRRAQVLRQFS